MTLFEIRHLAEITADAMAVMPASDAADHQARMHAFIQCKNPDVTADQWGRALAEAATA